MCDKERLSEEGVEAGKVWALRRGSGWSVLLVDLI